MSVRRSVAVVGIIVSAGCGAARDEPALAFGDPTEAGPLGPSCERRDPGAGSPPSFHWSVDCHAEQPMSRPQVAVLGDGGIVVAFELGDTTSPAGAVTLDLGGGALIGAGGSDVVVARFDAAGQHVWSQLWGSESMEGTSALTALPDGGVALGLSFGGAVNVGGEVISPLAEYDELLINLDAAGELRWSRRWTPKRDGDWSVITAVDSAADGSLVMAAHLSGEIELVAGSLFVGDSSDTEVFAIFEADGALRRAEMRDVDVSAPALGDDGSLVFATPDGLQRIGRGGQPVWMLAGWRTPGAPDLDALVEPTRVMFAPNGDVVVAGAFSGTINFGGDDLVNPDFDVHRGNFDLFVARFGADGSHRWSLRRDGPAPDSGRYQVVQAGRADETVLVYGVDTGPTYLEVFGLGGASLAARTFSAGGASGGGLMPDGTLVIAGASEAPIDLGGGPSGVLGEPQLWFGRVAVR